MGLDARLIESILNVRAKSAIHQLDATDANIIAAPRTNFKSRRSSKREKLNDLRKNNRQDGVPEQTIIKTDPIRTINDGNIRNDILHSYSNSYRILEHEKR